jgi:hypothetical protein
MSCPLFECVFVTEAQAAEESDAGTDETSRSGKVDGLHF